MLKRGRQEDFLDIMSGLDRADYKSPRHISPVAGVSVDGLTATEDGADRPPGLLFFE